MECLFFQVDSCCHPIQPLYVGTETRMSSIIDASKIRNDGLHLTIEQNCSSAVHYHKNCVSTYTSKCHMKRMSHTIARSNSPQPKRKCRADLRNFDFNTQCLFCGDLCEPDTKHPSRHLKRIVLCKTADRPQLKSLKAAIVDHCHARGDQWSNEVLVRVEGTVSDLHAADARYHYDCKTNFMAPRSVQLAKASTSGDQSPVQGDPAYDKLVREMSAERSRIRNSSEIYQQYQVYGGMIMVRRTLMAAILAQFGEDLLVFTAVGIASILVFREKAADMFSIIPDDHDDDLEQAMKTVVDHS